MDEYVRGVTEQGFAWVRDGFADLEEAFAAARVIVDACAPAGSRLDVVGDFAVLATMTIGGPIILWRARLRQTNETRDAS